MTEKNPSFPFLINLGLLVFGAAMIFSGLLIQIGYHMGHHGEIDAGHLVFGLNYFTWSLIHKMAIVIISIAMVFHIVLHGKWYQTVLRKKELFFKNQQVIVLTIVSILAAITGYLAWFINLSGGTEFSRKFYIEIHDKIALILMVYLIFHVAKRFTWFLTAFGKIRSKKKQEKSDWHRETPSTAESEE
ncbi:MAG: DUF4405 domain-containing protein [Deltaproteobacteria bacterium]|nr:DUF4405 domain-containing protein [Deltaproteobacteria bacterium]